MPIKILETENFDLEATSPEKGAGAVVVLKKLDGKGFPVLGVFEEGVMLRVELYAQEGREVACSYTTPKEEPEDYGDH